MDLTRKLELFNREDITSAQTGTAQLKMSIIGKRDDFNSLHPEKYLGIGDVCFMDIGNELYWYNTLTITQ